MNRPWIFYMNTIMRLIHRGVLVSPASALSRGGREGGLPDLRQFKVSYHKHSQMKDKPLP